jgi:hypothetical protein
MESSFDRADEGDNAIVVPQIARKGENEMDFVTAWKASSIVLTGAFGVLGLLTEFREKDTKTITKWGYFSLGGILISTVLSTVAQLKESSDDAKKSYDLARESDRTLNDIERALFPMTDPVLSARFTVSCDVDSSTKKFCANRRAAAQRVGGEWIKDMFNTWPSGQPADIALILGN